LVGIAVLAAMQDAKASPGSPLWLLFEGLEALAVLLLGMITGSGGWSWILYYMLALHVGFTLPPRQAFLGVATLFLARSVNLVLASHLSLPALIEVVVPSAWLFGLVAVGGRLTSDQVAEKEALERLSAALDASNRELSATNALLQGALLRAEEASALKERHRVAREIHDGLGHTVTILNLQLEAACRLADLDPARAREYLLRARSLAQAAAVDVRRAIQALRRPFSLDGDLVPLVERVCRDFTAFTAIEVQLEISPTWSPLPAAVEQALYRALQEALTNVLKHSRARRVRIRLTRSRDVVRLVVADDGRGGEVVQPGFGLTSIAERVEALGGRLGVRSRPGRGFLLRLTIPRTELWEEGDDGADPHPVGG
jgi:signal transduction histidine kinase